MTQSSEATGPGRPAPDQPSPVSVNELLRILLEASEILADSFDFSEGVGRLAQLMVETVAPICLVDVVRNRDILRLAAAHRDPALQPLVEELRDRYPPEWNGPHPVARVIGTQQFEWRPEMSDAFLRATTQDPHHYDLVRKLRFGSFVSVPIAARGEVIGALTVIRTRDEEPFDRAHVDVLVDLARRAAVHLHNAQLYEEREAAQAALRGAIDRLGKLQQLTDLALAALPFDAFLDEVMRRVQIVLNADTVRVLLATEDGRTLRVGGERGVEPSNLWRREIPVAEGFAGRVAASRKPLVLRPHDAPFQFVSPALARLAIIAGVPLLVGDELVGVLHVGNREPRAFDSDDLQLVMLAGERIAIAIDLNQRYARERRKTVTLQQSLLPAAVVSPPGCRIAVRYWPADDTLAVGGDFYDVFDLREADRGVLIGDVAGKGVNAAALTGLARHTVRSAARHSRGVEEPLRWLNEAMLDEDEPAYCTALYGELSTTAGSVHFEFAAGGHPLPVVVRADGTAATIGAPGTALGVLAEPRFTIATVDLAPGDVLVLYTDGVTDTRREPLDDAEVRELFARARGADIEAMADEIEFLLRSLRPRQEDDIALLLLAAGD